MEHPLGSGGATIHDGCIVFGSWMRDTAATEIVKAVIVAEACGG